MFYVLIMLATGCLIAMQSPINTALSRHTGMLEASLISFFTGFMALGACVLLFGRGNLFNALHAPVWQWSGGLLGAAMVCAAIICVPHIGVSSTALAMIAGNLAMSAVIDNYGWFGVPVIAFDFKRFAGFCLLCAGLYLIFRR